MLKNISPFLVILVLVSIFFSPILFGSKIFITPDFGRSDILHLNYPIKNFLSESLKKRELPLWNPYNGNGYPQLAEGQMGTFNPENLLIFSLLPMPLAFNLGLALIFFQAGVFTYLFCRSINLSKIASLFSAITFSFSGVFVTHIVHFNLIQTLSFLPLQMYLVEKFLQSRFAPSNGASRYKLQPLFLLLLSTITAVQLLSGFQQVALYSIITVCLYVFFKGWILKVTKPKKSAILLIFTLTFAFALTLSAIQLLPSWELAKEAGRSGGVGYTEMGSLPLNPKHLLSFFNPYMFGDPRKGTYPPFSEDWGIFWESTGYLGILPLIFAASGIFFLIRKNRQVQFFTFLLLLSLLLMTGKYSPLYLVFEFPPLNLFRVPARWIEIFAFCIAILGGLGLQFVLEKIKKIKFKYILGYAAIIVATFDLFLFGMNYNAIASAKEWLSPPPTFDFLKDSQSFTRTFTLGQFPAWNSIFLTRGWQDTKPYLVFRNSLDPDFNLLYHLPNFWVYESIVPQKNNNIKNILDKDLQYQEGYIKIGDKAQKILDLYGVSFLISTQKIEKLNLEMVFETKTTPDYFVYKNNNAVSRIYFPEKVFYAQTVDQFKEILQKPDFNPYTSVVLKEKLPKENFDASGSPAKITSQTDTEIKIEVTTNSEQLLVLEDSYYPGWEASDNGKQAKIFLANGNQKAIFLRKGDHKIRFVFKPQSLKLGEIISLFSAALILAWFLLIKKQQRP